MEKKEEDGKERVTNPAAATRTQRCLGETEWSGLLFLTLLFFSHFTISGGSSFIYTSKYNNTTQADPQFSLLAHGRLLLGFLCETPQALLTIREPEPFLLNRLFSVFPFSLCLSIDFVILSAAPLACFSWDKCTDFKQQHWSYFNDYDLSFVLMLQLLMSSFDLFHLVSVEITQSFANINRGEQ